MVDEFDRYLSWLNVKVAFYHDIARSEAHSSGDRRRATVREEAYAEARDAYLASKEVK